MNDEEGPVVEETETVAPAVEPVDAASPIPARRAGVEWVRPTELMSYAERRVAASRLDFHPTLARRSAAPRAGASPTVRRRGVSPVLRPAPGRPVGRVPASRRCTGRRGFGLE